MKFLHNKWLKDDSIAKIEEMKDCKYVCDLPLRSAEGGWVNAPAAIFYNEEPHPDGSNYFGIMQDVLISDQFLITDAVKSVENPFSGLKTPHGVMFSTYRYDYYSDGEYMVDGGLDYFKHSLYGDPVKIQIIDDELTLVEGRDSE